MYGPVDLCRILMAMSEFFSVNSATRLNVWLLYGFRIILELNKEFIAI